jgi:hypothetical protein
MLTSMDLMMNQKAIILALMDRVHSLMNRETFSKNHAVVKQVTYVKKRRKKQNLTK